jgi:hypothetical protein
MKNLYSEMIEKLNKEQQEVNAMFKNTGKMILNYSLNRRKVKDID